MDDRIRSLPIFDGVSDTQLAELVAGAEEVAVEPGTVVFAEGDPAEAWWVLVDGVLELSRHVGREDVVVGRMDVPGRWAGGFRAWDPQGSYLATGRCVEPGAPAAGAGRGPAGPDERVVPPRRAPHQRPLRDRPVDRVDGAPARLAGHARHARGRPGPRAEQPGGRGDPQRPGDGGRLRVPGRRHRPARPGQPLRRPVPRARAAAPRAAWPASRSPRRSTSPTGRRSSPTGPRTSASTTPGPSCRPSRPRAPTSRGAAQVDELLPRHARPARPPVGRRDAVDVRRARRGAGRDAPDLRARRVGALLHPDGPGGRPAGAGHRGARQHPGDARPQAGPGHRGRQGVRRGPARRSRPSPASSTRCGPTCIDNAIDAIGEQGRLRVAARADGDGVVVEIADSGPGLPPEVAARAFDAFFTTKEVGRGTGLGLDIARRIVVERHGGTIDIDRVDGETVLRVRLPGRERPTASRIVTRPAVVGEVPGTSSVTARGNDQSGPGRPRRPLDHRPEDVDGPQRPAVHRLRARAHVRQPPCLRRATTRSTSTPSTCGTFGEPFLPRAGCLDPAGSA